jgi:SAM-dependent methyltransferase
MLGPLGPKLASRAGRLYFEYLHLRYPDPYELEQKAYAQETYDRELAAISGRVFQRALEIGCSQGSLTGRLAERCESVLAVDVSRTAVWRARRRLAHVPGVRVERRRVPRQMPKGPFDLIVCSEVLYYWTSETLLEALPRLESALAAGGVLLALHWRGENPTRPQQADDVHDLLSGHTGLDHALSVRERDFRLDRFDKPAAGT